MFSTNLALEVVVDAAVFIMAAADLIEGKRSYVVSFVKVSRLLDIPTVVKVQPEVSVSLMLTWGFS